MTKTILKGISPDTAPKTIGPYVHAMIHQETVFTTCIIPLDPKTDELIGGKAEDQFRRIYTNLKIVLEESGSSLDRIIKQNIYLTNMEDFWAFNLVTEEFLGAHRPARATMQVLALPKGAPCGMDVVAALN
ncbi:hypothetical protein I312_106020 [Cryptococcus bacillisporus CA1280]|uniref:uncharacterized protein n=1 Tax=Cryptococcus bacillisporus CA1280 TaxID=1296109 RepID=UPI0033662C06